MLENFKAWKQEQGFVGRVIPIYGYPSVESLSAKLNFTPTLLNGAIAIAPYGTQYEN